MARKSIDKGSSLSSPKIRDDDERISISVLKSRVRELESEVQTLKARLDGLRKAKNQTIIKKETETVIVQPPNLGARRPSKTTKPTQKDDDETDALASAERTKFLKEANALKARIKELEDRLEKAERERDDDASKRDAAAAKENSELRDYIAALQLENEQLRDRLKETITLLQEKEAQWCEREEELKRTLAKSWQQKYEEWIRKMETRLDEVQRANDILQALIRRERPPSDPEADRIFQSYMRNIRGDGNSS